MATSHPETSPTPSPPDNATPGQNAHTPLPLVDITASPNPTAENTNTNSTSNPRNLRAERRQRNTRDVSPGTRQPPPDKPQHIRIKDHLSRPHLSPNHRSLSDAMREIRRREEQETLLGDEEEDLRGDAGEGAGGSDAGVNGNGDARIARDEFRHLGVYFCIHRYVFTLLRCEQSSPLVTENWLILDRIRRIVLASIDDPYTMAQLKEPRMNVLIVKPLVDRLFDGDDISVGK